MKSEKQLNSFPVFRELTDGQCEILAKSGKVQRIACDGGIVEGEGVFCILSGEAAVYSSDETHPILLRCLRAGDIFGVATLYAVCGGGSGRISRIRAKGKLRMLRIPPDVIDDLLRESDGFRRAYLGFLSDRIAFLNRKIACVTAGSAERKLASWLLDLTDADEFALPVSVSDLSVMLDLGRASLYRAFDLLSEKQYIQKDGNRIRILDREAMQNNF